MNHQGLAPSSSRKVPVAPPAVISGGLARPGDAGVVDQDVEGTVLAGDVCGVGAGAAPGDPLLDHRDQAARRLAGSQGGQGR
ncbi:hypothetical protein [Streptomyces sp. NPDC059957]|uniref:hypothetical protein n=1 Tax=unclassified Streptomyces TaxID=2593676 RepID=UPI00364A5F68